MIIDMHAHMTPEQLPPAEGRACGALWPCLDHFEAGRAKVMIDGRNFRTIHAGNWDVERRLTDMAAHGADAQVLSPMPELLSYWFSPADGLDMARYVNEAIAAMCVRAPGHFWGLGMVPLQDPALAAAELANVAALRLAGIELGSNVNGAYLGDPRFREVFQEAERLGLAIFVHSLKPTMTAAFPSPELANPIGFPTETCLTIASFVAGGTAELVPDLRIAFSHGGGTFPFLLPRYQYFWGGTWNEDEPAPDRLAQALATLPRSPAEYARRFFYDALLFDRRSIRYLIDMVGHRQVMIGTDYPYMPPEQPADATLRSLGLADEEHEAITWTNTFRFLGIDPPGIGAAG